MEGMVLSKAELGERLKKIREWRGVSQQELCTRIHAQQSMISRLERGISNLHAEDLMRIAAELRFNIDAFLRTGPNGFDIHACLLPMPHNEPKP
jgi:transcriptional regulator with XRE-family HTH domain